MLSQTHTMCFIEYWLATWKRQNKKPHEVVVDESDALLGPYVLAFTQLKSVNSYLSSCMDALLYDDSRKLPDCCIRIDRHTSISQFIEITDCKRKKGQKRVV